MLQHFSTRQMQHYLTYWYIQSGRIRATGFKQPVNTGYNHGSTKHLSEKNSYSPGIPICGWLNPEICLAVELFTYLTAT